MLTPTIKAKSFSFENFHSHLLSQCHSTDSSLSKFNSKNITEAILSVGFLNLETSSRESAEQDHCLVPLLLSAC